MKLKSIIFHSSLFIFLTVITQIGGIVWLLTILISRRIKHKKKIYVLSLFILLYLAGSFIVTPPIASYFGRVPLPKSKSSNLAPCTYLTVLLNRHYVTRPLKRELLSISNEFEKSNPGIKTVYLDANFPFWDGFPLIPHLSHNDGKKVDLSFIYTKNGRLTNSKPANSGYGYYEPPLSKEYSLPDICKKDGHWQYSLPQYLTFGSSEKYSYNSPKTKELLVLILNRKQTQKVFIEPHLAERMQLKHSKLRYQGCHSVRHDDHIHYQIR